MRNLFGRKGKQAALVLPLTLVLSLFVAVPAFAIETNSGSSEAVKPVIQAETAVAKVNGTDYDTLAEAFAAVPTDGTKTTVTLLANVVVAGDEVIAVEKGQNIVFDMQGKSITCEKGYALRPLTNNGTLTVTGKGTIDTSMSSKGKGSITNNGNLTIENGTYRGSLGSGSANVWNESGATLVIKDGTFDTSVTAVNSYKDSTTTITGGYFESPWYPAFDNSGNATIDGGTFVNTSCSSCDSDHWGYTIRNGYYSDNAYLRINYAEVTGTQGGVTTVGGTLDIYDGVFKTVDCEKDHGAVFYALYVAGESYKTAATVYDGTFSSEEREAIYVGNSNADGGNHEEATLVVKGGSFTGGEQTGAVHVDNELGGLLVSEGTFSSELKSDFLAPGHEVVQDENGNWVAQEKERVAEVNGTQHYSFAEAVAAAEDGDTITLLADAETAPLSIEKGLTIDLASHKLSIVGGTGAQGEGGLYFKSGTSVIKNGTLLDERGTLRSIAIVAEGAATSLTTEGVEVLVTVPQSGDSYGMRVIDGAEATLNNGTVIKAQKVDGRSGYIYGVTVYGNGTEATYDELTATKLTVNDGATIEAHAFAVSGNGDRKKHNTLITINGGTLVSEIGTGIYHPQYGKLVVNGGIIQGSTGIEMRAGELEVNGGTIKGDLNETITYPSGGGNTVDGAGIAVMQHTTKLPIKVTVNGGTVEADTAFMQQNIQNNDQDAVDQIDLSVTDGEFIGKIDSENFKAVDGKGFVAGGSFSDKAVKDVLVENAAIAVHSDETPYDIYPTEDDAVENGGAHKVTDADGTLWVFEDKEAAEEFAAEEGTQVETITYTVTFDDCLGDTENAELEVVKGDTVSKPAVDPVCEGYKFLGWYTGTFDENGAWSYGEAYDFTTPVTSDLLLVAKWEQIADEPTPGPAPEEPTDEGKDVAEGEDTLAETGDSVPVAPIAAVGFAALAAAGGAAYVLRKEN